jgi:hypothetical protein
MGLDNNELNLFGGVENIFFYNFTFLQKLKLNLKEHKICKLIYKNAEYDLKSKIKNRLKLS